MTNEKEKSHAKVAELLESTHCPKHGMEWEACCLSEVSIEIHNKVITLLATVRAEEREAAFKVLCPDCTEGDTPTLDNQARWFYHRYGHDDVVGCSASKLRLAAAENGKGEG